MKAALKRYDFIHDDINLIAFVIPGLTRNPVFSWIPAFAGMTTIPEINVAVYRYKRNIRAPFPLADFRVNHYNCTYNMTILEVR